MSKTILNKVNLENYNYLDDQDPLKEFSKRFYYPQYKTKIPYVDFRRNIVTEGIELNNLIKKEMEIGKIKILPYELCRPCLHLEQMVNGKNIVKEFLIKGGLRCEVLVSGKVKIGDKIKIL